MEGTRGGAPLFVAFFASCFLFSAFACRSAFSRFLCFLLLFFCCFFAPRFLLLSLLVALCFMPFLHARFVVDFFACCCSLSFSVLLCLLVYLYIYTHTHTYTPTCIHTYMHAYIHTYIKHIYQYVMYIPSICRANLISPSCHWQGRPQSQSFKIPNLQLSRFPCHSAVPPCSPRKPPRSPREREKKRAKKKKRRNITLHPESCTITTLTYNIANSSKFYGTLLLEY